VATKTKTEDLHNYPFDADIFRNTFNGYVRKYHTIFAISVILMCAPFVAYMIVWYLEMTKVDITGFFRPLARRSRSTVGFGIPSRKLQHNFIGNRFSWKLFYRDYLGGHQLFLRRDFYRRSWLLRCDLYRRYVFRWCCYDWIFTRLWYHRYRYKEEKYI